MGYDDDGIGNVNFTEKDVRMMAVVAEGGGRGETNPLITMGERNPSRDNETMSFFGAGSGQQAGRAVPGR